MHAGIPSQVVRAASDRSFHQSPAMSAVCNLRSHPKQVVLSSSTSLPSLAEDSYKTVSIRFICATDNHLLHSPAVLHVLLGFRSQVCLIFACRRSPNDAELVVLPIYLDALLMPRNQLV